MLHDADRDRTHVDAEIPAAQLRGRVRRRAAAAERVEHQPLRGATGQQQRLQEAEGFLCRISEVFPVLLVVVGEARRLPDDALRRIAGVRVRVRVPL